MTWTYKGWLAMLERTTSKRPQAEYAVKPTQAQIDAALKAYNASTKSSYQENAMRAALTAAAEVDSPRFIIEADHDVIAATIERCAQVVEDYPHKLSTHVQIAAAIRALKRSVISPASIRTRTGESHPAGGKS